MLEAQKKVLSGVSNSKELFRKELIKSHAWLNAEELDNLKSWAITHFYTSHSEIIDEVFLKKYNKAV